MRLEQIKIIRNHIRNAACLSYDQSNTIRLTTKKGYAQNQKNLK